VQNYLPLGLNGQGRVQNFSLGTGPNGRKSSRMPKARAGFLVRGSKPPSHQLGGLGSIVSSSNGVRGGAPTAKQVFHYFQYSEWPHMTLQYC